MLKFALRHAAGLLVTLLLVSVVTAGIFSLIPGDPALIMAGTDGTREQLESLRESLGVSTNFFERYAVWLKNVFTPGSLISIQYGMSVSRLLVSRLAVTSSIAFFAIAIMLVISVPLGFLAAYKKNTWVDALVSNCAVVELSIPNYLTGILIIWIFGITLRLFTPGQFVHYSVSVSLYWKSLFFPALALALPNSAMLTKFICVSLWSEMHQEYTVTAKSKGARGLRILFFHIAQNAAAPVLTLLGILIADILSGSIVIEQVFALPGLGRLLIGSIGARDFPVVITITVYIAFIVVIVNFVFEFLSRLSDPRTRLDGS
jgi:ABC-type dipeptide/oligopeptide/nickel transport system permease component